MEEQSKSAAQVINDTLAASGPADAIGAVEQHRSQLPKFIRISQAIPISKKTYEEAKREANELFNEDVVEHYFLAADHKPMCRWGTAIYRVEVDGTLTCIEADYDTSD